jgi:hypothetical protein
VEIVDREGLDWPRDRRCTGDRRHVGEEYCQQRATERALAPEHFDAGGGTAAYPPAGVNASATISGLGRGDE